MDYQSRQQVFFSRVTGLVPPWDNLEEEASKRNRLVMSMTKSSGSEELNQAVVHETLEDIG